MARLGPRPPDQTRKDLQTSKPGKAGVPWSGESLKSQAPSRPASPPRQAITGMTLSPPGQKQGLGANTSEQPGAVEQPGRMEIGVLLHITVSAALPQLASYVMQRAMKLPFGPSRFRTVSLSSATSISALRTLHTPHPSQDRPRPQRDQDRTMPRPRSAQAPLGMLRQAIANVLAVQLYE